MLAFTFEIKKRRNCIPLRVAGRPVPSVLRTVWSYLCILVDTKLTRLSSLFNSQTRSKYYSVLYNDDLEYISERQIDEKEAENIYEYGSHGYISLENYLQRSS